MDWANERYVRLYVRDTVAWKLLPWQSRAIWPLLLRKMDRAGRIPLEGHGARGLAVLIDMPADVVEPGLEGLLADGCVRIEGDVLVAPGFVPAQTTRSSDRVRKADERDRRAAAAAAEAAAVTERDSGDAEPEPVTSRHQPSPDGTGGHSMPSLAMHSGSEPPPNPPSAGAAGGGRRKRGSRRARAEPSDTGRRVLERVNELAGTAYEHSPHLEARIAEGVPEGDLLAVVESKAADPWWLGTVRLRPSALFRPEKFREHLGETKGAGPPPAPVSRRAGPAPLPDHPPPPQDGDRTARRCLVCADVVQHTWTDDGWVPDDHACLEAESAERCGDSLRTRRTA